MGHQDKIKNERSGQPDGEEELLTRRRFLRRTAGALGAAALPGVFSSCDNKPSAAVGLHGYAGSLTDQYGKPFDAAAIFNGKPYLVIFGKNECQYCSKINITISKLQKKMLEQGIDMPIVVVSVNPDEDRKNMRDYTEGLYKAGIRGLKDDKMPDSMEERATFATQSYNKTDGKPAGERILYVVCPKDNAEASNLQKVTFNLLAPTQHSTMIVRVDKDKTYAHLGRATTDSTNEPDKVEAFAENKANEVIEMLTGKRPIPTGLNK